MNPVEIQQASAALIGERGDVPDPYEYAAKIGRSDKIATYLRHFGEYLRDCGVRNFTALEVSTPSRSSQKVAEKTSPRESMHDGQFVLAMHPMLWQPYAALLVYAADPIRDALGAAVTLRNGERPWWINQHVASSGIASDHPMGVALDMDLSKKGDLAAAHRVGRHLYDDSEKLGSTLGVGERVIHFGLFSPLGHRDWSY